MQPTKMARVAGEDLLTVLRAPRDHSRPVPAERELSAVLP
jgi:hypothetical protein